MPAPPSKGKHVADHAREPGVIRLPDRWGRGRGMEIDRDVEFFGLLEDGPNRLVIQEATPRMAIDQGTLETQLLDRALELLCSGCGVERREDGEPGEPVWVV